jgi:uncharacterized phage protein gp47/JayE
MRSVTEITNSIVEAVQIKDPLMSCDVGSPERLIVEAVSSELSKTSYDLDILAQRKNVNNLSGSALDAEVAIYGFGRRQGAKSKGVLRFQTKTAVTVNNIIPFNTKASVQIADGTILNFFTTASGVIAEGASYLDLPAIAEFPGANYNVDANAVTITSQTSSEVQVTNPIAFIGGRDTESDSQLRERYRQTRFRGEVGTTDYYAGLCFRANSVSRVRVLDAEVRYQEQLQLTPFVGIQEGWMTATSSLPVTEVRVIYPGTFTYTELGTALEKMYTEGRRAGDTIVDGDYYVDYSSYPLQLFFKNSSLEGEDIIFLEYSYCPIESRNRPYPEPRFESDTNYRISNKVDIFEDGNDPIEIFENITVSTTTLTTDNPDDYTYAGNWQYEDGTSPRNTAQDPSRGMRLFVLGEVPIVSLPSTISYNGITLREYTGTPRNPETVDITCPGLQLTSAIVANDFGQATMIITVPENTNPGTYSIRFEGRESHIVKTQLITVSLTGLYSSVVPGSQINIFADGFIARVYQGDYRKVTDITDRRGSQDAKDGLIWLTEGSGPADGIELNFSYIYDRLPRLLDTIIDPLKQANTDLSVHKCHYQLLDLGLAIEYNLGESVSSISQRIQDNLISWANNKTYGEWIELSDILKVVVNTQGVDAGRLSTSTDPLLPNGIYGLRLMEDDGSTVKEQVITSNFRLKINELPLFNEIAIIRVASNTLTPKIGV